jgi:hypothetical protein
VLSDFEIAESACKFSHLGSHADYPHRRRKTRDELIEGREFFELYDRAHNGRLTKRLI